MTLLLALFYHNSCQNLWNYLVRLFELLDFWSNKKKWRICKIWMQTQLIMDYDISIPPNCQRRRLLFLLHCFREKSELQTPSYGGCKASHWWSRTQKLHPELTKSAKDSRWKLASTPSKVQFSPGTLKAMKERIIIKWTQERDSGTIS